MFPIRDINPSRTTPVLTWALIAANVLVFFLLQPKAERDANEFAYKWAAVACEVTTGDVLDRTEVDPSFQIERPCQEQPLGDPLYPDKSIALSVLFSMFFHGGLMHLFGNMLFLFIFGNNVEDAFGKLGYLAMYLASGVVATLGFVWFQPNSTVPLVGASGAIAGVIGAYVVLYPAAKILTVFALMFIPVPAIVYVGIWFISQFLIAGSETSVAWQAHVAGFLFGLALAMLLRIPLLRRVQAHRVTQFPALP